MTNTVKIGDEYEKKCFHIISSALKNEELCFPADYSVLFEKSKHFSKDRNKDIIFDLTVEVTPKNSEKIQLLGIIECKNYSSKKVPVDDIESFYSKVNQVSGGARKAIVITNSGFQASAFKFAEANNIMLINTNDDDYSIILHRTKRFQVEEINLEQEILKFLIRAFYEPKITGLKKLSSLKIEDFAKNILLDYSTEYTKVTVKNMITYLYNKYDLNFILDTDLTEYGEEVEGIYNIQNKTISIDNNISNTPKMTFILGHEIGHFFLHSNLKINNNLYNNFNDSNYNILEKKYDLISDKDWIEWQANKFSSSLFLQKDIFMERLIFYRKNTLGIRSPEKIYLDNQPCNISDYYKTIDYLSRYFETTKLAIEFKLKELNILTDMRKTPSLFDELFTIGL